MRKVPLSMLTPLYDVNLARDGYLGIQEVRYLEYEN